MAVFPLFIDICQKKILVVGAGVIASRKIEKLLSFEPDICVVGQRVSDEIVSFQAQGKLKLEQRLFEESDLDGAELVIVAVDDLALQAKIFEICQARKIPCNCVDSPAYCSFIFPALITRDDLVIGISTGGKAPGFSAFFRRKLESFIPGKVTDMIKRVSEMRKDPIQKGLATYEEKVARVDAELEKLWKAQTIQD